MSNQPIKIVIEAESAEAAANIKSFVSGADSGLKMLATNGGHAAKSLHTMREAAGGLREGMHLLEIGLYTLGGEKFPELAEGMLAVRTSMMLSRTAAILFGVSLTTVGIAAVAMLPAIATGVQAWRSYDAALEAARAEHELFAQTQELIARNWEAIDKARDKGLISGDDHTYIERLLSIGSESSLAAAQKKMGELGISGGQLDAFEKLRTLKAQMHREAMDQSEQEGAKAGDEYVKRLKEIEDLAKVSKLAAADRKNAEQDALKAYQAQITKITEAKQATYGAKLTTEIDDELFFHEQRLANQRKMSADDVFNFRVDRFHEAAKQGLVSEQQLTDYVIAQERLRVAGLKVTNTEWEEQLKLQREIYRGNLQGRLTGINGNPLLTSSQKAEQSLPLYYQQHAANTSRINDDTNTAATTNDPVARQKAEEEILQLKREQADLQLKIQGAEGEDSPTYQLGLAVTHLQDMNNLAKEVAASFEGVFNSSIARVSNGITGLIMGTMTWKQFLQDIPRQILTEIVGAIVQMGVRWVATQIMMATIGRSIAAAQLLALMPIAAAESAIFATPAALATISSYGGAAAAAPLQISGAVAMTHALAGFEDGGFTGGAEGEIAGAVHGQEYVLSAPAVRNIGVDNLNALHTAARSGGGESGGAPAGGVGKTDVLIMNDQQALTNYLKSSTAAKIIVAHIADNKLKLGIQS